MNNNINALLAKFHKKVVLEAKNALAIIDKAQAVANLKANKTESGVASSSGFVYR
jgi:hypothetical protein